MRKSKQIAKLKAVWNGEGWDCVVKTRTHIHRKSKVTNLHLCDEWVMPMALLEHNGYDIGIICEELNLKAE